MVLNLDPSTYASIEAFRLPSFSEIPNVGLYLNQTCKFINQCLEPISISPLTENMISNYVKKHIVSNPIKKQYSREQIATLLFIAVAKGVASLDDISLLMQKSFEIYSVSDAYEFFRVELEKLVKDVFGVTSPTPSEKTGDSFEKELVRNILLTVAHTVYLSRAFAVLGGGKSDEKE